MKYLIGLIVLILSMISFTGCSGGSGNTNNDISASTHSDTSAKTDTTTLKIEHLPMKNIRLSAKAREGLHISSYLYLDGDSITTVKDGNKTVNSILSIHGETFKFDYVDENTTILNMGQYQFQIQKHPDINNAVIVYPYENGIALGGYTYNYTQGTTLKKRTSISNMEHLPILREEKDPLDDFWDEKIKEIKTYVQDAVSCLVWFAPSQETIDNVHNFYTDKITKLKIKDTSVYLPARYSVNDPNQLEVYPETGFVVNFKRLLGQTQKAIVSNAQQLSIALTEQLKTLQERNYSFGITQTLQNLKDIDLFIDTSTISETISSKKANYYLVTEKEKKFVSPINEEMLTLLENDSDNIMEGMEIEADKLGIFDQQIQNASTEGLEGMIGTLSHLDFDMTFEEYYVKHFGEYPTKIADLDTMEKPELDTSMLPDIPNFSSNYLVYTIDGIQKGGLLNNVLIHDNDKTSIDNQAGIHAFVWLFYNSYYNAPAEYFLFLNGDDVTKTDFSFYLPTNPTSAASYISPSISFYSLAELHVDGLQVCRVWSGDLNNISTAYTYKNVLNYTINDDFDQITGEVHAIMYHDCSSRIESRIKPNGESELWANYKGVGTPHNIHIKFRFEKKYIQMMLNADYVDHLDTDTIEKFPNNYESFEEKFPNHNENTAPSTSYVVH